MNILLVEVVLFRVVELAVVLLLVVDVVEGALEVEVALLVVEVEAAVVDEGLALAEPAKVNCLLKLGSPVLSVILNA